MSTTPKPVTAAKSILVANEVYPQLDQSTVPDWLTVLVDIAEIMGALVPLLVLCGLADAEAIRLRATHLLQVDVDLLRPMIRRQRKAEFSTPAAEEALSMALINMTANSTATETAAIWTENTP